MKRIAILAASVALTPALALAGSLEPPVPVGSDPSWAGPYAGLSYGQTTVTESWQETREDIIVTETEVPVYDTCKDVGGHSGGEKCVGDRDNIDLTFGPDLPYHERWTQTGLYNDQDKAFLLGESVTIVDANGAVISQGVADSSNPNGTLYRLDTGETETVYSEELIKTLVDMTSEDTSNSVGAFVGYRQEYQSLVYGAELGVNGDLMSAEAQLGLNAGNLLPYAFVGMGQFDGAETNVYGVGADMKLGMIADNMFAGAKFAQGDFGEQATLRVGFNF